MLKSDIKSECNSPGQRIRIVVQLDITRSEGVNIRIETAVICNGKYILCSSKNAKPANTFYIQLREIITQP